MSRQDANAAFASTPFLWGGNAGYIEDQQARYERDPQAVGEDWRAFFQGLKDGRVEVLRKATGPSWRRPDWPVRPQGDSSPRSTATGPRSRRRSAEGSRRSAQIEGVELSSPGCSRRPATRFTP